MKNIEKILMTITHFLNGKKGETFLWSEINVQWGEIMSALLEALLFYIHVLGNMYISI